MAGKPWVGIGRVLSVCLLHLWIVVKQCKIDPWLLFNTTEKSMLDFPNREKNEPWMILKGSFQGHES